MNDHTQSGGFVRILKWFGVVLLALLGLLLILGLLPVSRSGSASTPDPAASYAEAVARYEAIEQAESGIVNSVSGSKLLSHGDPHHAPMYWCMASPTPPCNGWNWGRCYMNGVTMS